MKSFSLILAFISFFVLSEVSNKSFVFQTKIIFFAEINFGNDIIQSNPSFVVVNHRRMNETGKWAI